MNSNLKHWLSIIILVFLSTVDISAKGGAYSFEIETKGKGSPLILIPGLTCSGKVWDSTVAELSQSYECHIITIKGFAGLPAIDLPSNGLTSTVKQDIIAYIQDKKLNRPGLIGHSLGGFIALDLLSSYPETFSKSIIVDGLPFFPAITNPMATEETMKATSEARVKGMRSTPTEQFRQQQRMVVKSMVTSPNHQDLVYAWGEASDPNTVFTAMEDMNTTDLRDDISKIKSPVLVLGAYVAYEQYGVTKEMTLNNYKAQFAKLPNVRIELSDIGRHFIMLDDPTFMNRMAMEFLSE
ncbi:alpha/beta fold hydrolase [Reichenbachiella versicolor]|uniref:alpha/beta fold hydrolase n=1 Tax=Reichenbachiella versicolor TaxID=1821036 RepID=UPI0013A5739C|nr:alpha/beta hydrolase [Reichenbachiella versicolor]